MDKPRKIIPTSDLEAMVGKRVILTYTVGDSHTSRVGTLMKSQNHIFSLRDGWGEKVIYIPSVISCNVVEK